MLRNTSRHNTQTRCILQNHRVELHGDGVIGIFSVTQSFRSHYGPGVDSVSNRNEYQVYFLGVKVAGA